MAERLRAFSEEMEDFPALHLFRGITPGQIEQLIALTQEDETIRRFDTDDDRFGSWEIYEEWKKKGRTIYALSDKEDGTLYGIFWIGEQSLPEDRLYIESFDHEFYRFTQATRLYNGARNRHISSQFVMDATDDFMRLRGLTHAGVWAAVSDDNEPSKRKNLAIGHRIVTTPNENNKIIMIREYITK